ncbi:hydrogenase expression/formation protein HypE [Kordiimonas lipolytica]|uniref:Hydrogenase expression/formation protein HypE n=1 Tax=Kordiimonas lipolytica TaxID=1662421 RepID=A0ABV8UCR0_9PROT|nr:hydrogenase expression/formation protein HypE [Kordiimonas lipolytica]
MTGKTNKACIEMAHGGGGRTMDRLITDIFRKHLDNEYLSQANDGALLPKASGRLVMATDGHVISPLFFPGGNIGSLAIHGTVNDVAMMGATPLYISASFILEEGFPLEDLEEIVRSMGDAARQANVSVVTGDTKVVEKGKGDGVFISTTGVGVIEDGLAIGGDKAVPGQAILINGTVGDHGVAILSKRENLEFETEIVSDSAALNGLVSDMLAAAPSISVLRDPTRGGLAATLNEIAGQSGVGMLIEEEKIPLKPAVSGACELLGLDPLNIANEGKLVCICNAEDADKLLSVMHAHPLGKEASMIGAVTQDPNKMVRMTTMFGGTRMIDWLAGEQLPRIC